MDITRYGRKPFERDIPIVYETESTAVSITTLPIFGEPQDANRTAAEHTKTQIFFILLIVYSY